MDALPWPGGAPGPETLHGSTAGFSLVESVIAIAIIAVLAAIGVPNYLESVNTARIVSAMGDIKQMSTDISVWSIGNIGAYPESLDDVGFGGRLDPWGNPYQYLNVSDIKNHGKCRKDKNLVPLNSDYDLYSKGRDGRSVSPLTAKASRDDVIRASNGGFIGLGANY
jgi:general secretion pathway protein G